jgi:exosome complex exonuclease RRP6
MPISSQWDLPTRPAETDEDLIPFPWQKFVQQGSIEGDVQHDTAAEPVVVSEQSKGVASATDNAEDEVDDAEFTLKKGQKRKSQALEESDSSEEDSESDSDEEMQENNGVLAIEDETDRVASRNARRKQRKAEEKKAEQERLERQEAKKARKAQKKQKKQDDQEKVKKFDAVPFDYSKAASVLNPTKEQKSAADAKPKKKFFDPYSKASDTNVKGARKAPPVKGERSATFKK